MGIDRISRNVIDQIGLQNHRLASHIDWEEAETCGKNLIKLLGVLLRIEDRDSGSLRSLIRMVFGQEEGSGDRCARRQSCAPDNEFSSGNAHSGTPNACSVRCRSRARQTTASVLVSSMLERPGRATREV